MSYKEINNTKDTKSITMYWSWNRYQSYMVENMYSSSLFIMFIVKTCIWTKSCLKNFRLDKPIYEKIMI